VQLAAGEGVLGVIPGSMATPGYVVRGRLTFRYADHDEVYETGDAYYAPPGHIPVVTADTEVVEFSPTEEHHRTLEVVARNMAAVQA